MPKTRPSMYHQDSTLGLRVDVGIVCHRVKATSLRETRSSMALQEVIHVRISISLTLSVARLIALHVATFLGRSRGLKDTLRLSSASAPTMIEHKRGRRARLRILGPCTAMEIRSEDVRERLVLVASGVLCIPAQVSFRSMDRVSHQGEPVASVARQSCSIRKDLPSDWSKTSVISHVRSVC